MNTKNKIKENQDEDELKVIIKHTISAWVEIKTIMINGWLTKEKKRDVVQDKITKNLISRSSSR